MKVLLVSGSLPPMRCGVGDYTHHLATSLSGHRSVNVAVATSKGAAEGEERCGYERFPVVENWNAGCLRLLFGVAREWRPDIVHFQFPTQGYGGRLFPWYLPLIFRARGYSVVQTWHEYYTEIGPSAVLPFIAKAVTPGPLVVVRPNFRGQTSLFWRWALWNKEVCFIPNASALPKVEVNEDEKAEWRARVHAEGYGVVVYFGFLYPAKRVELLFEIADPARHRLVIIGELSESDSYHRYIRDLATEDRWRTKVSFTGFLDGAHAAALIASADAVVLPFREGGGEWNTSIHSAQTQGTFVLTTSRQRSGYDEIENTYFSLPEDVQGMKAALNRYLGRKRGNAGQDRTVSWRKIAEAHIELYEKAVRLS